MDDGQLEGLFIFYGKDYPAFSDWAIKSVAEAWIEKAKKEKALVVCTSTMSVYWWVRSACADGLYDPKKVLLIYSNGAVVAMNEYCATTSRWWSAENDPMEAASNIMRFASRKRKERERNWLMELREVE